ncbi:hypothetical protein J7K52_01755 [Candidatus Bathyarchaeota archaeon]|nr:hypothetical protein [Candidatus Bathyarchaeota archaeon]
MKRKIAVATVSGKAYYLIVRELEKLKVPFISLRPWDAVPTEVDVVITTEKERDMVNHPTIVTLSEEGDVSEAVGKAVKLAMEKEGEDAVVLGVDPGKTYGLALLVGREVYETSTHSTLGGVLRAILKALNALPFPKKIVRVGGGAQPYTDELIKSLDDLLPRNVTIEVVNEEGTTKKIKDVEKVGGGKDASSAVMIAMRKGKVCARGKVGER